MEFILLIGYTIGVYVIGIRRGIGMMLDRHEDYSEDFQDMIDEIERSETAPKEKQKIMIRIEYDENEKYFFVHEDGTNKFMAHGKTWQEVEKRLKERYPNDKFGIDEDHAREIGII